jgi:hypothetical protein
VWKVLRRHGASRLRLPAREPVTRYERDRPGELLHVDIKRLGRFHTVGKAILGDRLTRSRHAGWQYLHLAIDVDRPRFRGQRLVRRLVAVLLSFSRSRPATGSRAWSGAEPERVVEGLDVVEDGSACLGAAAKGATAQQVLGQ